MVKCKNCCEEIVSDGISCDGICGSSFHITCLKRSAKTSTSGFITCSECSDIKPCHVLRLMKGLVEQVDSLCDNQNAIANKVTIFSSQRTNMGDLSEDIHSLHKKVDKLIGVTSALESSATALQNKSIEISARVLSVANSFDDLHELLSAPDNLGKPGSPTIRCAQVVPLLEDIQRSIGQVKGDCISWSTAVSANSKMISAMAADMQKISLQRESSNIATQTPEDIRIVASPPHSSLMAQPHRRRRKRMVEQMRPNEVVASALVAEAAPPMGSLSSYGDVVIASLIADVSDVGKSTSTAGSSSAVSDPSLQLTDTSTFNPSEPPSLRTVPKPQNIFISRFTPDTTCEDITEFLNSKGIDTQNVTCRKISKNTKPVASFLLTVPSTLAHRFLGTSFWPPGTLFKEFTPRTGSPRQRVSDPSGSKGLNQKN